MAFKSSKPKKKNTEKTSLPKQEKQTIAKLQFLPKSANLKKAR